MMQNPFEHPPVRIFLIRIAAPAILLTAFLWACVGIIASLPLFQEFKGPTVVLPFWQASASHYAETLNHWMNIPEFCWPGNSISDFQIRRCESFWNELTFSSLLAALPFLGTGLLVWMGLGAQARIYRRAEKQFDQREASFPGTVTNPPKAKLDGFAWFFGFHPITIELSNRSQIKVYVPIEEPLPKAGDTLAMFNAGSWNGKKRYLGALYSPHVTVVSAQNSRILNGN